MKRLVLAAGAALGAYLLALGMVVLQPEPEVAVGSVSSVKDLLVGIGVPDEWLTNDRVEFGLNTLLFAPVTFLGALVFPRVRWSEWVVAAFVLSAGIELVQGLFFPDRMATFVDVVANTAGGLLGAGASLVVGRFSEFASKGWTSVSR